MEEYIKMAYDYGVQQALSDYGIKVANKDMVKMYMGQGMGAEEAARKAYPDWSDEKVKELAKEMG